MDVLLLLLLFICLAGGFGAAPLWAHSADWGYGPSGILGLAVVVLVVLLVLGR